MKIKSARLCNYRNIELAEASLDADSVWICGLNAQGKTNLLESVSLLGALRSFRTSKISHAIRHGEQKAQALFTLWHETLGDCEVLIEIASGSRKVSVNGEEQKRLGDFIGKFPITTLSNEDIKIVRGEPQTRRKFADMLISSFDSQYLENLRAYHAALTQRNALLKNPSANNAAFDAFENEMALRTMPIIRKRAEALNELAEIAGAKYEILSGGKESAIMKLKPSSSPESVEQCRQILAENRKRDALTGSTSSGPHRDDFGIKINSKSMRDYASEGQQRSAALAIKLAEYELLKQKLKTAPIMLCDDILGELDPKRQEAFWESVDSSAQIIATATTPPPQNSAGRKWLCIAAANGNFTREIRA